MGEFKPDASTTTNTDSISDYSVSNQALDYSNSGDGETYWYFNDATKNFGYYKTIPELKQSIDALARWTAGKGYYTQDSLTKIQLEFLSGWGEDTFDSIMENLIVVKKIIGDAFAEIVKEKDALGNNRLINLKPISPERVRIVLDNKGMIKRYDVWQTNKDWKAIGKENMLHLCNERVGDEIHGTSVIDACEWVIKACNEAMDTYKKIMKRSLA